MTDIIRAPWTAAQVEALNRCQAHGDYQLFCRGVHDGANFVLIARRDGMHCDSYSACGYRQDWAHAFMAESTEWEGGLVGEVARVMQRRYASQHPETSQPDGAEHTARPNTPKETSK